MLTIQFEDFQLDNMLQVIKEHDSEIRYEIVNSIEESFDVNIDEALIFEIENTEYDMIVKRQDWIQTLNENMWYFEEIEDFETCIRINKLIEKIKNYERSLHS